MWFKDSGDAGTCEHVDPTTWHEAEAAAGDPVAQFLHARRLPPFDPHVAHWLRRAAEGGFARAMNEYGQLRKDGHPGVGPPDTDAALEWFSRAADLGEPEAKYNLGITRLQHGLGESQANVQLLREAAEAGLPLAAVNLGIAYRRGEGVEGGEVDLDQAVYWLVRSDQPDALMQAAGVEWKRGRVAQAKAHVRRAAVLGDEGAQAEVERWGV
jgi:TPR repeat protein